MAKTKKMAFGGISGMPQGGDQMRRPNFDMQQFKDRMQGAMQRSPMGQMGRPPMGQPPVGKTQVAQPQTLPQAGPRPQISQPMPGGVSAPKPASPMPGGVGGAPAGTGGGMPKPGFGSNPMIQNARPMNKGGKVKKMAAGGKVSSASKRADGAAQRGKTKGRIV